MSGAPDADVEPIETAADVRRRRRVSVLLPVRDVTANEDARRWWQRALTSTLRSRGVDLDVVVVDHGSATSIDADTLAMMGHRHGHTVRVVSVPRDAPFAAVLEVGRQACQTDLIARMDADDVMHLDRLRLQAAALVDDESLSAVASQVKILPNSTTAMRGYVLWQNQLRSPDDHRRERFLEQPCCHPATMFKASALDAVGGYCVRGEHERAWPEDYDLFLRLLGAGHAIRKLPTVHLGWRQHAQQRTRDVGVGQGRDDLAACKAFALVRDERAGKRPVVVIGAGKEARRISRALRAFDVVVERFLDADPRKIGRVLHSAPIVDAAATTASDLPAQTLLLGAVGTSGARGQVRAHFQRLGRLEGVDAFCVA